MTPLILGVCATNRTLGVALVNARSARYESGHDVSGRDRAKVTSALVLKLVATYRPTHLAVVARPEDRHLVAHLERLARASKLPVSTFERRAARDRLSADKTYAGMASELVRRFPELKPWDFPARKNFLVSNRERYRQPVLLAVAGGVLLLKEILPSTV